MRHLFAVSVCIAVLLVLLSLGLWPFHAPRNAVSWLADRDGLQFGDYGTVMSSGAFAGDGGSCSIELWLQPSRPFSGGTILAFYEPPSPPRLSLHQSNSDFQLQGRRGASLYLDDIFRRPGPTFITLTLSDGGTSVYVDGTLAKSAPPQRGNARACTGRLILGDGARSQDTWSGQLRGIAVYYSALSAAAVFRHYNAWTTTGQPGAFPAEHAAAIYRFDERGGAVVRNHAGSAPDLEIPGTYTVLDQRFLEPFWEEFENSWGYWGGALKNIVGFVPWGFCIYAYFSLFLHYKRPVPLTVLSGTALSFTIEVLQHFLPTRQSGTTDLFTNTLGTYAGVLAYRAFVFLLADRLPRWTSWLAAIEKSVTVGGGFKENS